MTQITSIRKNDEYITPKIMLKNFCKTAQITYPLLDVAATKENKKCRSFYSYDHSALKHEWTKPFFCNPPYSQTARFLEYGIEQVKKHKVPGLYLLFAKTDSLYWKKYVFPYGLIFWINGRVQFETEQGLNRRCHVCGDSGVSKYCDDCGCKTSLQNPPYGSAFVYYMPKGMIQRYDTVDKNGFST